MLRFFKKRLHSSLPFLIFSRLLFVCLFCSYVLLHLRGNFHNYKGPDDKDHVQGEWQSPSATKLKNWNSWEECSGRTQGEKKSNTEGEDIEYRRTWRHHEWYFKDNEVKMQKEWVHKWRSNHKPEWLKFWMKHFNKYTKTKGNLK